MEIKCLQSDATIDWQRVVKEYLGNSVDLGGFSKHVVKCRVTLWKAELSRKYKIYVLFSTANRCIRCLSTIISTLIGVSTWINHTLLTFLSRVDFPSTTGGKRTRGEVGCQEENFLWQYQWQFHIRLDYNNNCKQNRNKIQFPSPKWTRTTSASTRYWRSESRTWYS